MVNNNTLSHLKLSEDNHQSNKVNLELSVQKESKANSNLLKIKINKNLTKVHHKIPKNK